MHLEGPWLSTTGKKKGKKKFASAEAKRKAEHLDREWQELLKRQGVELETKRKKRAMTADTLASSGYGLAIPQGRNTTGHIKSLPFSGGSCTMPAPKVYTGNMVKGIATMHKSNAVPVFSSEEAIDISKMRR
jgi:hypothetical protein